MLLFYTLPRKEQILVNSSNLTKLQFGRLPRSHSFEEYILLLQTGKLRFFPAPEHSLNSVSNWGLTELLNHSSYIQTHDKLWLELKGKVKGNREIV